MILTASEKEYIENNFIINENTDLADLCDALYFKTLETLDDRDYPTSMTFFIEKIMDKLSVAEISRWGELS